MLHKEQVIVHGETVVCDWDSGIVTAESPRAATLWSLESFTPFDDVPLGWFEELIETAKPIY